MIIGVGHRSAQKLFEMGEGLATPHQVVTDWTSMEEAVAQDEPDVLALYLDRNPGHRLNAVQRLLGLFPGVSVIALIDQESPALVKMISAAGCADFVVIPDCPADLRRALKALQKRSQTDTVNGEATTIWGAKGGGGTTTVACNLADALSTRMPNKRVILVDLNLYMGDIALTVDLKPDPTTLFFLKRVSAADAQTWLERPPQHRRGFRVMGLDGDLENADPVTAEQIVFLVERLRHLYDYVILDCGSSVSEVSMAACTAADRTLLIFTEQLAARLGARRRIGALRMLDPERRAVQAIVNRIHDTSPDHLQRIQQSVGVMLLETISNAWQDVSGALEAGQTLLEHSPRSPVVADFNRLAEHIAGEKSQQDKRKKAFFDFFR